MHKIIIGEFVYKEVSLTIETTIWALQEIDPLIKRQQAAFLKSNEIFIVLSDTIKTHLGVNNLKQPNVIKNFELLLSFFSFPENMLDSEKAE